MQNKKKIITFTILIAIIIYDGIFSLSNMVQWFFVYVRAVGAFFFRINIDGGSKPPLDRNL